VDASGTTLRHVASRRLTDEVVETMQAIPVGPDVGSCGAAAYHRARIVVEDVASDPRWKDFRDLAARAGLAACWSEPILAGDGRLLGTLAMYYRTPRGPTPAECGMIELGAHLAGIAVERGQARSDLERYVTALDAARGQAEEQATQLRAQTEELAHTRDQALSSARVKSFAYQRFTGWPPGPLSTTARSGKRVSTSVVRSSVSSCRHTSTPSRVRVRSCST